MSRKNTDVLKAIAVTAELTNTEMSESALEVFEADLADYSDGQILAALTRCRRELRGRLTVADVVQGAAICKCHARRTVSHGIENPSKIFNV